MKLIKEGFDKNIIPFSVSNDESKQEISPIRFDSNFYPNINESQEIPEGFEGFKEDSSFLELVGTHAVQSLAWLPRLVSKGFESEGPLMPEDPEFNPDQLDYLEDPKYDVIKSALLGSKSKAQADIIKTNFDYEFWYKDKTEHAGFLKNMAAAVIGGTIDPMMWMLPWGKLGQLGAKSYSFGKAALVGSGINTGSAIPETLSRLYTDEMFTEKDAFLNIGSNAILGGLISGSSVKLSADKFQRSAKKLEQSLNLNPELESKVFNKENFDQLIGEIKLNYAPEEANRIVKGLSQMSLGRTTFSKSEVVRNTAKDLFDYGSLEGKIPAQTIASQYQAEYLTQKNLIFNKYYKQWLNDSNKNTITRKFLKTFDLDQQRNIFNNEVGKAMRMGDKHSNPVIQQTAKDLREIVNRSTDLGMKFDMFGIKKFDISEIKTNELKPIKKELSEFKKQFKTKESKQSLEYKNKLKEFEDKILEINNKILEIENKQYTHKDLKVRFAEGWLNRVYNTKKIRENPQGLIDILYQDWIDQAIKKGIKEEDLSELKIKLKKKSINTVNKLTKSGTDRVTNVDFHLSPGNPSSTKMRLISTPDEKLIPYLINDADIALNSYFKSYLPAVALTEKFGSASFQIIKPKILKDAKDNILLNEKLTEKQRLKAFSKLDEDILDLECGWNRIRNITQVHSNMLNSKVAMTAIRTTKNLVHATKAGFIAVSAAKDIQNQVLYFGIRKTLDAHLKLLHANIVSKNFAKANRDALRDIGLAADTVLHLRQDMMNDLAYGLDSNPIELGSKWLAGLAFKFNGVAQVDTWTRTVSNYLFMQELRRTVNSKKPTEKQIKFLFDNGISPEEYSSIRDSLNKYGIKDDRSGLFIANLEDWDSALRNKMARVMKRFEEHTTILPGAADTPRMFDNPAWALLFTYKRFILAATQKITIPAIQGRNLRICQAMIAGFGMSMLADTTKYILKGENIPDIDKLSYDSFARIDLFGALPEIYDMALTSIGAPGHVGYGRNIVDQLAGPAGSLAKDIALIGNARFEKLFNDEPYTQSDLNRMRRTIPLAEHFALSRISKLAFGVENKDDENGLKTGQIKNKTIK